MTLAEILATVFMAGGLFFFFVGGFGLVRLPDFYLRLHPAGKADSLGAALLLTGLAILAGPTLLAVKILMVEAFILLANPTSAHAIARAATKVGLPMWTPRGPQTVEEAVSARVQERRGPVEDQE